jgi:hypothetical protein
MKQLKLFDIKPQKKAITVDIVLATGFSVGDKVKYKMNYNGAVMWWDGVVIDIEPEIRLMIKFFDGFKIDVTVRRQQMQWLKKACC